MNRRILSSLLAYFETYSMAANQLLTKLNQTQVDIGVAAGGRVFVAALISNLAPMVLVTSNETEAQELESALKDLVEVPVLLFPAWETLPHEKLSPSVLVMGNRISVLQQIKELLLNQTQMILICSVAAFCSPIMPQLQDVLQLKLIKSTNYEFDYLINKLDEFGYHRVDLVNNRGEFAVRGGIIDLFPSTFTNPLRLDFWGNSLTEIRMFSVIDQRSLENKDLTQATIYPSREILLTDKVKKLAYENALKLPQDSDLARELREISTGKYVAGMESLAPLLFSEDMLSIIDFLPPHTIINLIEPEKIKTQQRALIKADADFLAAAWEISAELDTGVSKFNLDIAETYALFDIEFLQSLAIKKKYKWWTMSSLQLTEKNIDVHKEGTKVIATQIVFSSKSAMKLWGHKAENILSISDLRNRIKNELPTVIIANKNTTLQRIKNYLIDNDIVFSEHLNFETKDSNLVFITRGSLIEGIHFTDPELLIIVVRDLHSNKAIKNFSKRPLISDKRSLIKLGHNKNQFNPLALRNQDLIVHEDYGIGKFIELITRNINGVVREYLVLEYASSKKINGYDRLYVPVDSLDKLSKYIGQQEVSLSRLGGNEWKNTKRNARKAALGITEGLVKLYAVRQAAQGFAFSPDTPWQQELEDAFMFNETKDQLKAIAEVKFDMEKPIPMDRIIVGDVGYGKTEIAVRAAFKAVQDNKQVAVLVPTTLLAQQHFKTFTERMSPYPVSIKELSRFTPKSQMLDVKLAIAKGTVDIVIGTHKLLNKELVWKSLGLVVIDEEQRFGVDQKEYIKKFRNQVDVLSMSATPIPRTLEMSLVGIREMSLIQTPPETRLPILTYVGVYEDRQVKAAIKRELLRGGQVFYVYNKVETIDVVANKIKSLIPEARVIVAHGRMPEEILEKTVLNFWNKEYDVLVCTTIIETGLDIANANTLIVEDATRLGLAQLHQLRGRVGRASGRGYAYFFYPAGEVLTEYAHKRLVTIAQNNELGSGMAVALKDLELRGSGNILGEAQSGHVVGVGLDLYVKMVGEALDSYKALCDGKELPLQYMTEVKIEVPISAYIPKDYIQSEKLRLAAYQNFSKANSYFDLENCQTELIDRFGSVPDPILNLIALTGIKILAQYNNITEISIMRNVLKILGIELNDSKQVRLQRLFPGSKYKASVVQIQMPVNLVKFFSINKETYASELFNFIYEVFTKLFDINISSDWVKLINFK